MVQIFFHAILGGNSFLYYLIQENMLKVNFIFHDIGLLLDIKQQGKTYVVPSPLTPPFCIMKHNFINTKYSNTMCTRSCIETLFHFNCKSVVSINFNKIISILLSYVIFSSKRHHVDRLHHHDFFLSVDHKFKPLSIFERGSNIVGDLMRDDWCLRSRPKRRSRS